MRHRLPIPLSLTALLALASGCDSGRSLSTSSSAAGTAATCTRCHGDPASGNAAPPRSVAGLVDTALLGVGAHQTHLAAGPLRGPVACAECHVVPATVDAPGHMGKAYAAVTFGALATTGGTAASWDRVGATCTTYCHGATLSGGTNVAPRWTQVDGTQARCGTCHGTPPASPHPQLTDCGSCHPGYTATSVDPALHVDGKLELGAQACTVCHGDPTRQDPAPPRGTHGETATTSTAVGAHQSHLTGTALRPPIVCSECHVVPTGLEHVDGTVELAFGPLATTGGAAPSFDGTSCSSTYCHGATLNAGGSNTRPVWTTVNGTQAACGTCHGTPPGTGQHQRSEHLKPCGVCHTGYSTTSATSVNAAVHLDGAREVGGAGTSIKSWDAATRSCQPSCHDTQTW